MKGYSKGQFNRGFTMVELVVTIVIFAVLAAVAIPSFSGYYKKMDMINANESARQIYGIAQNKLSAMKVAGQLQEDQLEDEYGLFGVLPSESAASMASVDGIQYYYMNTESAVAFLEQAGQKLDEKLVNKQASIVIEMDPHNGYVFGVFYATYPESNEKPFEYSSMSGTYGLRNGTEEFRTSDTLRSQDKARIGYYGGESALLEYEAGLKTPMIEIINDEELILKISSYEQPTDFTGYQVKLSGKSELFSYEYECYIDKEKFVEKDGITLEGNYYNLLLDSLASGYSIIEILNTNFTKKNILSPNYKEGDNITISVEAVKKPDTDIEKQSFSNVDEVSSLYAERKENDAGKTIISVSNARHLQNLNKISDAINNSSTQVNQIKDINWQNTITYYKTLDSWNEIDKVENAPDSRIQIAGSNATFTPIASGKYNYSAQKNEFSGIEDSTEAGYRILNFPIEGNTNAGLFASFTGSLEHINLVNVTVQGVQNVGALVGVYNATNISGFSNKILNCSVYLDKELSPNPSTFSYENYNVKGGYENTGGLVGVVHSGEIKNSFAAIGVIGRNGGAGGLVGSTQNAKITSSYSTGQVRGVSGDEIALGGFIGICTQETSVSNCYTTSEITTMKSNMGSFVGKYASGSSFINIIKSYATGGLVSTLNWKNITQIDFAGSNTTAHVGDDCFYLGNEESNGAKGLNLKQLTGLQDVRVGLRLNDIYTIADGWRYPTNYGTGAISESVTLTHPYYLDQRLSVDDTVYPYSGLNDMNVAKAPIPHYGDWSLSMEKLGAGSFIFYYEKYANDEYGVYYLVDEAVAVNTLRKDDNILKWGYGIIAETSKINNPMDIYIRNENGSGTILASGGKNVSDWIDTNALTVPGINFDSSYRFYAFTDSSMKIYLDSMQSPTNQYLYTKIESADLYNMFNPCFGAAINSKSTAQINPSQMPVMRLGTAEEPFKIRHGEHFYYMGKKGYDGVESKYFYFEQTHYIDFQDDFIYAPNSFKENFYPKDQRYNGEFTPANPFVGVYNGNGFDIRGYVRESSWEAYQLQYDGLFGYVGDGNGNGRISDVNLHIKSVDMITQKALYAGIFAGYVGEKSIIQNCHIKVNEDIDQPVKIRKFPGTPFGGFVGSSSGTISNSSLTSKKSFECTYYITEGDKKEGYIIEQLQREGSLGGFAGENKTTGIMYECQVDVIGFIGSDTSSIAGFVGKNENVIQKCNVIIEDRIMAAFAYGFVGRNNNSGYILDCKVDSKFVESINYSYAVGFVGSNGGRIENSHVDITKILGAKAYGFALENIPENVSNDPNYKPSIVDCKVTSELLGTEVDYRAESVGFVGKNNGEILRAGVTVTKEINAQTVYGFAVENNIKGTITDSTLSCNKINASGISYGFAYTNEGLIHNVTAQNNENLGINKAYGFIYRNDETGTIENSVLLGNSIISNDDVFGFVWENKGIIEGVQVFILGNANNNTIGELRSQRVYGFAYANFKTIKDSTLVCNTIIGSSDVCGFARENSGLIENSTVDIVENTNLHITATFSGQSVYGFMMQNKVDGIIQDCSISSKNASSLGKIVGFVYENNGVIKADVTGCYANIPIVTSSYEGVAGFVNINTGSILGKAPDAISDAIMIEYKGNSILTKGKAAGFVLDNQGTIEYAAVQSTNPINIETGWDNAGFVLANKGSIKNSYTKSNLTSPTGNIAGFVSKNMKDIDNCYNQGVLYNNSNNWTLSIGGFAYETTGNISNCFSISSMLNGAQGVESITAGFAALVNGGTISNSYAITYNEKVNSAPYLFSKDTSNITNCFYLDWDGVSDVKLIDSNTNAEAKKMAELEKLVEENRLPSSIWQTNYKVTTDIYTYPTIIGLPLPDYNSKFEPDPPSWSVSGGDVTGGDVTSGDVTDGNVTGGDVTGGDASD